MFRHFLILVFIVLHAVQVFGQQSSLFSQYMFNGLAINPAYSGTHDVLNMTSLGRKQWVGVDGAPSTMTFSAHTPLKNEKVSVGVLFYGDKIGVFRQYSMNGIYAYKIDLTSKSKLSFGLQAGLNNYVARYSDLTSKDPNDPVIMQDDVSGFAPSFGAGLYYYTEKFYAGLSSPFLVNNILGSKRVTNTFKISSTYFFTTGAVFSLSDGVKFKPSFLLKVTSGAPIQADLNTNFLFREVLWLGVSLRSLSSLNFLTQFNVSNQLKIGYAYDMNLKQVANVYSGSHEVMISYLFSFNQKKVVTPRYF